VKEENIQTIHSILDEVADKFKNIEPITEMA
jgi:tRNA-dihydrouridine synthase B